MSAVRAFALYVALALGAASARAESPASGAALVRSLRGAGRAEATLRFVTPSLPGRPVRTVHAILALEWPDRARMDVGATGERIVLRADGGEWLQPATRQLLVFKPGQAAAALGWWSVLLGRDPLARERRVGGGRWRLERGSPGTPDTVAEVTLDARGLPARLVLGEGEEAVTYRLSGWHFGSARGGAGFHLTAPAGWEVVELP